MRRPLTGVAIVLALTLAGCGGDDSSDTASSGQSAAAKSSASADPKLAKPTEFTQLKVPYFGLEHIADAKGYFKKYNLIHKFQTVLQGTQGITSIINNQAQTMQGTTAQTALLTIGAGEKVKIVAAGATSGPEYNNVRFYTLKDSGITSAKQLIGKRVGMPAVVSYYSIALQEWLHENGVDPKQVKLVAVPAPSLIQALQSKQVDAIAAGDFIYTTLEHQFGNQVNLLFKDTDAFPEATKYVTGYIFAQKFIDEHPDVVRAYIAAIKDAAAYVKSDPEGAKEIIAKVTGAKPENIPVPYYPDNLCIDQSSAESWVTKLQAVGTVPEGVVSSPSDWTTNQYNSACKS
jgi:NitT/TauT family transport system substrate-binding protein